MKRTVLIFILTFLMTTTLQIRLFHDNKKGYSYNITGPSADEVIESDQKMRQYLKGLVPPKKTVPAPAVSAPKPAPVKK